MESQIYAVLTGDVVNSKNVVGYGELLNETFTLFEEELKEKLILEVDRYSGDRFQVLLSDPAITLRSALYLFTKLLSMEPTVQIRISIGVGGIEEVPEGRVSTGEGVAFRLSGQNLDKMKKHQRVSFEASSTIPKNEKSLIQGSLDLFSALLIDLTTVQAEVIWYKLRGLTQEKIARETGRKQQTVSDILIASYWRNLKNFLEIFEQELGQKKNKENTSDLLR